MAGIELKVAGIDVIVFDLFHTLVDPEDFRPRNLHRVDVAAEVMGLDKAKFSKFWVDSTKERMVSKRPGIEFIRDFVAESGLKVSEAVIFQADDALRKYQDIALLN